MAMPVNEERLKELQGDPRFDGTTPRVLGEYIKVVKLYSELHRITWGEADQMLWIDDEEEA
jgi:hypothetical protein